MASLIEFVFRLERVLRSVTAADERCPFVVPTEQLKASAVHLYLPLGRLVVRLVVLITDFVSRRFAQSLGCDESSLKECAKKKTFQEIIDAQIQIYPKEHVLSFCPVVDGYFLPGTETNVLPV